MASKKICPSHNLQYLKMWIWKSGLCRWGVKMRSSWIRVGPKSNDWCLYKRKERRICHRARHRGEGHGESMGKLPWEKQRKIGVMLPEAKEEARKDSPLEPSCGARTCWHVYFGRLGSRTVRELASVALSHPVVVICYDSPRRLIQWCSFSCYTVSTHFRAF